jgi:iron complex transport system permease protein
MGGEAVPWDGPALDGPTASFVLSDLRFPRVALGALTGGALALTGAAFQVVLENPLATPSTIGTTAGASLGALAVLVLGPAGVGAAWVSAGAFAGALAVSLAMGALATQRRFRSEELLLAGIAIGLGASAATTGLQLQADASATLASVRWSLGSLSTVGYGKATTVLPLFSLGAWGMLRHLRALQAMTAGAERAGTQGVDVVRVRAQVLTAGSLVVAGSVAATGPIAFVGLIVPHLVRMAVGGGPRTLLPMSAVAGAGFLPLADGLARIALPGRDLPVGVLTALLGAPALLALIGQRQRP